MLIDQWLMSFSGVTLPVLSAAAALGMATISSNSILYSSRNQIKGLTTSVRRVRLDVVDADAERADGRHKLGKIALALELQMHLKMV